MGHRQFAARHAPPTRAAEDGLGDRRSGEPISVQPRALGGDEASRGVGVRTDRGCDETTLSREVVRVLPHEPIGWRGIDRGGRSRCHAGDAEIAQQRLESATRVEPRVPASTPVPQERRNDLLRQTAESKPLVLEPAAEVSGYTELISRRQRRVALPQQVHPEARDVSPLAAPEPSPKPGRTWLPPRRRSAVKRSQCPDRSVRIMPRSARSSPCGPAAPSGDAA